MICPFCATAIPGDQPICPVCFTSTDTQCAASTQEDRRKNNLITFMPSESQADFYYDRVFKYLQPDRVGYNFCAWAGDSFVDITKNSAGTWNLLIVGDSIVENNMSLLLRFQNENPSLVIGIEYAQSNTVPLSPPLAHAVMFVRPGDVDRWLELMHSLLSLADRS